MSTSSLPHRPAQDQLSVCLAAPAATDQIRVISGRRPPWAWFDKRIITRYGRKLGPHGIAVYMALTVHADGELQTCLPSYQTIANEIGVSKHTVMKAIKLLIVLHLVLKQVMQSPEGDPGPNLYTLLDVPATPPEFSTEEGGVVHDMDHPSPPAGPPVVHEVDPNKNGSEQDVENKSTGAVISIDAEQTRQKPQPPRYGRWGYTPQTPAQLAERKALLRQQAAQLARQEAEQLAANPAQRSAGSVISPGAA